MFVFFPQSEVLVVLCEYLLGKICVSHGEMSDSSGHCLLAQGFSCSTNKS